MLKDLDPPRQIRLLKLGEEAKEEKTVKAKMKRDRITRGQATFPTKSSYTLYEFPLCHLKKKRGRKVITWKGNGRRSGERRKRRREKSQ